MRPYATRNTCLHVYTHTRMHTHIRTHTFATRTGYMHACTHTRCTRTHTRGQHVHALDICTRVSILARMHSHTRAKCNVFVTHMFMHSSIHAYARHARYICACINLSACIHAYAHLRAPHALHISEPILTPPQVHERYGIFMRSENSITLA